MIGRKSYCVGAEPKRVTTAVARAARAGIVLHVLEGDFRPQIFIATRWAMTRQFDDIAEVEAWLDFVTGTKGAHA